MKWKNPVQTRAAVAQSAPSCIPGFATKVASGVSEALSLPRNIRSNNRYIMTSSIAHGKITGRDSEAQRLVTTLLSSHDENPVAVVSVIGVGGIGKTALAQHVYNTTRITENFDVRMWICVTDLFDELRITKEMLESASSSRFRHDGTTNFNRLQVALKARLASKRFFLVLDDVWNNHNMTMAIEQENWQKLLAPLQAGAKGSKILLTTRSRMVAEMLQSSYIISLEALLVNDCWSVIKTSMCDETNHTIDSQLEDIGRKIAETLSGLPLAAKVVAGRLKCKHSVDEWKQVLQRNAVWEEIMPILRTSYENLPAHLKQCFAYCSIFPRDWEFESEQLILLWIAQGFVHPDGCRRMEDIGKEYLLNLCNRSFFTIQNKEFVSYYVMPPVIYELAKSVATEECFRIGGDEWTRIPSSVRHLSVHLDSLLELDETIPYKNLRTLIFLTSRTVAPIKVSIPQVVLDNIQSLRVLDLSPCKMDRLPDRIRQCVHLRYLNVSSTTINTLPEYLCKLYHLQVLNLSGCRLEKLPSRMNNLVNLRHLTAANQIVSAITDIGRLKCLQRLPIFKVTREETHKIAQLGHLHELQGSLQIRNLENVDTPDEAKEAVLHKKDQLSMLQLMWASDRDEVNANREEDVLEALQPHQNLKRLDIMGWMGVKSPSWLESKWLSYLELIFLSGCNAWEQLPPLGQLPSVRTIWLQRLKMLRQIGPEAYGSGSQQVPFQSLEELVLDDMPELSEWLWSGQTMRNVRNIVIKDCEKLQALPPLPPNFTEITTARKGYWVPYHHDVKLAHATTGRSSVSSLCIFNCPLLLASFSSPMTNEIIASFGSLRSIITDQMTILRCPLIRERLELIESLEIQDCSEMTSFSTDDDDVLRQLKSLQSLCISGCNSLQSLPSTLSGIESLYKLVLWNCPELESLTKEPLPLSLRKIEVALCHPLLKEKLIKEYGVDWPKIAHIPWIEIEGEILQRLKTEQ
ncbi:putative disease resistance RPP13-like protein 1 isoform X2 [Phragmites australis]|uniref:putative disease resistance RPP13-like protein 1 isoform X2 n=1 Tax=Phragmites australis TaxID=29695 RepID=UPI002D79465F|nr:putative disease resistance RPP13-like protein 1 isoform X2 [Phragmites australis]